MSQGRYYGQLRTAVTVATSRDPMAPDPRDLIEPEESKRRDASTLKDMAQILATFNQRD